MKFAPRIIAPARQDVHQPHLRVQCQRRDNFLLPNTGNSDPRFHAVTNRNPYPWRWTGKTGACSSVAAIRTSSSSGMPTAGRLSANHFRSVRVDSSVFDPETKLAACSTGDGTIHIIHEDSPDAITAVQTVQTEFGAKTMALDAKTHNLLVDTSDFETPAADGKLKSPQPRAKSGTFRLRLWLLRPISVFRARGSLGSCTGRTPLGPFCGDSQLRFGEAKRSKACIAKWARLALCAKSGCHSSIRTAK